MRIFQTNTRLAKVLLSVSAGVLALALTGCSASNNAHKNEAQNNPQLAGVQAEGKPGEKPKISFHSPMTVDSKAYAVLQEGNGETINKNDRLCFYGIIYDASNGTEVMNTWDEKKLNCSMTLDESQAENRFNVFAGQKLNTTIAFGLTHQGQPSSDPQGSGQAQEPKSYIYALTAISKFKVLDHAEGQEVTGIDPSLPKVSRDDSGKPSIDMNGYKPGDKLVVQPLIQGTGEAIGKEDTAVVKYTGWLMDGKQFDSSWDRNSTFEASMRGGVIEGWLQGLVGQKVGSQVLLIIPPSLAYGEQAQGEIPANSTLAFVIDIVGKY